MVRCTCCHELVVELLEVPDTRQLVCATCLSVIRGMLGVWNAIGAARQRIKPGDAQGDGACGA